MAHIPKWCGICKGARPKVFCSTENRYVCTQCNLTCFKYAHNWTELENEKAATGTKAKDAEYSVVGKRRDDKGPKDRSPRKGNT